MCAGTACYFTKLDLDHLICFGFGLWLWLDLTWLGWPWLDKTWFESISLFLCFLCLELAVATCGEQAMCCQMIQPHGFSFAVLPFFWGGDVELSRLANPLITNRKSLTINQSLIRPVICCWWFCFLFNEQRYVSIVPGTCTWHHTMWWYVILIAQGPFYRRPTPSTVPKFGRASGIGNKRADMFFQPRTCRNKNTKKWIIRFYSFAKCHRAFNGNPSHATEFVLDIDCLGA